MQSLEVSGAVRLIYKSLGVKGLTLFTYAAVLKATNEMMEQLEILSTYCTSCLGLTQSLSQWAPASVAPWARNGPLTPD